MGHKETPAGLKDDKNCPEGRNTCAPDVAPIRRGFELRTALLLWPQLELSCPKNGSQKFAGRPAPKSNELGKG